MVLEEFKKLYPKVEGIERAFCPYRVCPVGAHSDHQYGLISGFAIDKGIEIVYVPSNSKEVEVTSMNFEGTKKFLVDGVISKENDWADYIRGASKLLYEKYNIQNGIYCVVNGELPIGRIKFFCCCYFSFYVCYVQSKQFEIREKRNYRFSRKSRD